MDTMLPRLYKKSRFAMKCMKILLILMNALYLNVSFLMIGGAYTLKVFFEKYYFVLSHHASFVDSLSSLGIATGCFLLALSIFGIVAAVKESTSMTNFYGFFLCLIFIVQMTAALIGFTLTDGIVRSTLENSLMRDGYRSTIEWVQETFKCCGIDGPSDWENFESYFATNGSHFFHNSLIRPFDPAAPTTEQQLSQSYGPRLPESCCKGGSGYDQINFLCQEYFIRGCHGPLNAIIYQSLVMIGSSAVAVGIVQVLGVVCAFMFVRFIRQDKTNRDVQRWAINQSMGFERPAYVDQIPNIETIDGEKQI